MDEREMWVFEDDVMGCSECYEDRLDDCAILPAHEQPHKQMDAGICGMCGYVLDPTMSGYAEQLAERLRDAVSVLRRTPLWVAGDSIRAEGREGDAGGLYEDVQEATRALLAMAERLTEFGVDKSDLSV